MLLLQEVMDLTAPFVETCVQQPIGRWRSIESHIVKRHTAGKLRSMVQKNTYRLKKIFALIAGNVKIILILKNQWIKSL